MQRLYSNTPILTPVQWPAPRLRGQESKCPAPPRLHSFTSALSPLAIICGLFAPPRTQQCRKNGIIVALLSANPVGAPLVVPGSTRTHAGSARLKSKPTQLSLQSGLLVGVRQRHFLAPSPAHHCCF